MIAELPTTSPRTTVVTVARPLPPNWPTPTLPCAHAELLPFPAPPGLYEATAAAEEHRWTELNQKKSTPATPPSKKAGKEKKKVDSIEIRAERNQAGTLCKCGKADTEKFMLQCDGKHSMHADAICMHTYADALTKRALALSLFPYAGCDVWYHGDCVGVTQAQGMRLKSWRCKPCARRHESMQARCELYCVCRGPWDGKSFMIACDGCDVWFHGACVGLTSELSARQGAEAAFRRYHCPLCVSGATTAPATTTMRPTPPTTPTTAAAHGGHGARQRRQGRAIPPSSGRRPLRAAPCGGYGMHHLLLVVILRLLLTCWRGLVIIAVLLLFYTINNIINSNRRMWRLLLCCRRSSPPSVSARRLLLLLFLSRRIECNRRDGGWHEQ